MGRVIDVKTHGYGRLFDANGQAVRYAIRADLDTGECDVYATDSDGKFLTSDGAVFVNKEFRPAPLAFVKRGD